MKKNDPLAFLKLSRNPIKKSDAIIPGMNVLITGATSGIGLSTAHRFAQAKANLIILVRNEEKANQMVKHFQETYGISVRAYIADFSSLPDVHRVVKQIQQDLPSLDVLINNAGVYSTKKILTPSGFELGLTVNHLASLLITLMLKPLLQKGKQKRIIQVNSEGHRFSGFPLKDPNFKKRVYTGLRSYGSSKTAQLLTVWELAKVYIQDGITLNAMHPGEVQSNIGLNNGWLYRLFKKLIINRMLKSVQHSAESIFYLATSLEVKDKHGAYFHLTTESTPSNHALPSPYAKEVLHWSQATLQQLIPELTF